MGNKPDGFDIVKMVSFFNEEKLPQVSTFFVIAVSLFIGFATFDKFTGQFINTTIRGIMYVAVLTLWLCFWLIYKYRYPRNKNDKIGIVIAIYSENENERLKLKDDFLSKIKNDIRNDDTLNIFEIISLKNHFSNKIKESRDVKAAIRTINKKIKAQFFVCGDVKKRPDGNHGEKYYINFNGCVMHKPIPIKVSETIAKEFSKVLPSQVKFDENDSFKGFEATATLVSLAAKYIIGIAAYVSQDPRIAYNLHLGLKAQLDIMPVLPLQIQEIKSRLPIYISDEALWLAKGHYISNRITEANEYLDIAIKNNEKNYSVWLLKAIIDFMVSKNVEESFKSIGKAELYAKNTHEWRYSKAFLYFWIADYPKAIDLCQKIKTQNYINENVTLEEVRAFNLNLLKQPLPKAQLYFWIGYLSYHKVNNLINALQDFEMFEKLADASMYILKNRSSAYLIEIKQKLKKKPSLE